MNETLLAYLMGQLEPDEVHRLEADLAGSADLRHQLALYQRALAPLAYSAPVEPPVGLAARTLAFVQQRAEAPLPAAPVRPLRNSDVPHRPRGRWIDLLLAASILLLLGGMGLVAVSRAWHEANLRACQQNLASLWHALAQYGQHHHGALPAVHQATNLQSMAGAYLPILNQAGFGVDPLPVACPSQGRKVPVPMPLPALEKLAGDDPERFRRQMRDLAGDYAYTLGYRQGEQVHGPRLDAEPETPLLADAPSAGSLGNSPNHGQRGQNVLFVGGHVRWLGTNTVGPQCDDIYQNRQRQIRVGLDPSDAVLALGDARAAP